VEIEGGEGGRIVFGLFGNGKLLAPGFEPCFPSCGDAIDPFSHFLK
jgi:hypothetical protein